MSVRLRPGELGSDEDRPLQGFEVSRGLFRTACARIWKLLADDQRRRTHRRWVKNLARARGTKPEEIMKAIREREERRRALLVVRKQGGLEE